jgi:hypothetical protein
MPFRRARIKRVSAGVAWEGRRATCLVNDLRRPGLRRMLWRKNKEDQTMTIKELSHDEQLALVALIEALAMTDASLSEAEEEEVGRVAAELGDEPYRALLDEAEQRCSNIKALKRFLKTISNPEARELIYGEVLQEAGASPAFDRSESELLSWLAEEWKIPVEIEPESEDKP